MAMQYRQCVAWGTVTKRVMGMGRGSPTGQAEQLVQYKIANLNFTRLLRTNDKIFLQSCGNAIKESKIHSSQALCTSNRIIIALKH